MSKYEPSAPPPAAPPSYSEVMGGVSPSAPLTAAQPSIATVTIHNYVDFNSAKSLISTTSNHKRVSPGPTIVTTVVPLGPRATHMVCPHCYAEIETSTKSTPGLIAYISGTVIALVGCFWGCCLIPCCLDSCMDVHHTCPNCHAFLGRYRR